MADDLNTMAIQAISPEVTRLARSQTLATATRLRTLQSVVLRYAGGGPTFAQAQEPIADGVAFTDVGGVAYYRPQLAVAGRGEGRRPGPDVWFLKNDDGVITLTWTLETVPLGGAMPVPFTITAVTMDWDGGSKVFQAPGVTPVENHGPDRPAYLVQGGAQLTPQEASTLETAMNHHESACRLTVTYTYDYIVQVETVVVPDPVVPDPVDPDLDVIIRDHRHRPFGDGGRVLPQFAQMTAQTLRPAAFTAGAAPAVASAVEEPAPAGMVASLARSDAVVMHTRVSDSVRDMVVATSIQDLIAAQPPVSPEQRTQTVVRTIPFVFEPSDEQNGPIYRSLHGRANLTDAWEHGEAGWVCDSVFPNTVNRLPDAIRLAWNPELGGPHMVPTLHRDSTGTPRVRLLMRLAPFQDPQAKVLARKLVGMPAATIVIGEVAGSTLHLGGSFPEELSVIGDAGAPAPLTGVDLTLDLSLAYYQLFCQQISTPIGVPGQVSVVLDTPPAQEGEQPVPKATTIDVALRLDRVDDLPCTLTLPDALSPATVTVTNRSGVDITVGGASVTLLQTDEDSAVPVDTMPGRCTATFPVTIAAGARVDLPIEVEPDPADPTASGFLWNAVLVELTDKRVTTTPDVMLRHVHELAGGSEVSRDITVSSPVFSTGTLPAKWAELASIEVEVTAPGGRPVTVALSTAAPSKTVAAPITLQAVADGASGGITTVGYRVRNNYLDHQGAWSLPQDSSGNDLIAYPNPADGD